MNLDPRMLRTGLGMDVHAFAPGRPLIIGGVNIPHYQGLDGHSDADVLTHAIMDALLGATRGGDIGKLFPPTDPAFKVLYKIWKSQRMAKQIIKEFRPQVAVGVGGYASGPTLNKAAAMGIPVDNVGVKATTTERLGYEGREEGVTAYATCLLARCS